MLYRCIECGHIFDEPKEYYGEELEFWGVPCRERFVGCPNCFGDYENVIQCEECGEYVAGIDDYYDDNLCPSCYLIFEQ